MNKCWCLWCILSWMAFVTFLCLCVIWATWEKSAFFFPPPFSSILRMRAFFSLLMFASVWLKAFNFFSKPVFEALLFLRSIRRLTLLTPSFAIMLFFSLWAQSVSLHWKQMNLLMLQFLRLIQKIMYCVQKN